MNSRIRELALEAAMVVFAVVVALAVEEWRDEQGLRDFAGRARSAVMAEVRANLEELQQAGPSLTSTQQELRAVVDSEDLTTLTNVSFLLPDVSLAAWTAAQVSQAAPYLDYEWVLRVARAYEAYETYARLANRAVDDLSVIVGRGPTLESVSDVYGSLTLLVGVHDQVEARFRALVEEEG